MSATAIERNPVIQKFLDDSWARVEQARNTGNPAALQAALDAFWELLCSIEAMGA